MTQDDVVQIPISVWETADSKEELEDWLLANDPAFIAVMDSRLEQDRGGQTRSLDGLARKWRIELG